jgi:hypothetical protein
MSANKADPFFDTEDAARYLSISKLSLRDMRYEKPYRGPAFHKFGRLYAYRLSDLNAWAEARKVATK